MQYLFIMEIVDSWIVSKWNISVSGNRMRPVCTTTTAYADLNEIV